MDSATRTDQETVQSAPSERARTLRVARLGWPRGVSLLGVLILLGVFAPRFALLLISIAAVAAGTSYIQSWMGGRKSERGSSSNDAAEGKR